MRRWRWRRRRRPEDLTAEPGLARPLAEVHLRTPVPNPPTVRDFYAFEQHVKAARARRGVGMIPEWYEIPVFYFSNTSALFGGDEDIPYPRMSQELDFELEVAAVIGQAGMDISADDAPGYIAGYMVMNDWSARDLQRQEMKMNLGPAKGKDFATSFGPWLVTPDELDDKRTGSGKDERYDLAMFGSINGDQLTSANMQRPLLQLPADDRARRPACAPAPRRHSRLRHLRHGLHPGAGDRAPPLAPARRHGRDGRRAAGDAA